jgi:hypothetical protein
MLALVAMSMIVAWALLSGLVLYRIDRLAVERRGRTTARRDAPTQPGESTERPLAA